MNAGRLKIAFIGAGKVGVVLAAALRAADHDIIGISATSNASRDRVEAMLPGVPIKDIETLIDEAELVFLTIPDDVLPDMVSGLALLGCWKAGQLVAHTSGRYGTSVLEPALEAGAIGLAIHPAMTFTGTTIDIGRMVGCGFAVTATNIVLPIAQALVIEMGGIPAIVAEEDRPQYHAALAHAANHTATIMAQSSEILEKVGISDAHAFLGPLVHASVDNALGIGASALTGPIVRGDVKTVTAHVHALQGSSMLNSYKAMARATLERAAASPFKRITDAKIAELREVLS